MDISPSRGFLERERRSSEAIPRAPYLGVKPKPVKPDETIVVMAETEAGEGASVSCSGAESASQAIARRIDGGVNFASSERIAKAL